MRNRAVNIAILGMGTVGKVLASAFAKKTQHSEYTLHLITRTDASAKLVADQLKNKFGLTVKHYGCDAFDVEGLSCILREAQADIVINVATPDTHINVMRACLATGSNYIDTAVFENFSDYNSPPPWYSHELALREEFKAKKLTAILSIGLVPGVVNVFCKKVCNDFLDTIETIDILCANAGTNNQFFATNFNAAVNLKELCENTGYWKEGSWLSAPPFSRHMNFDFPEIGNQKLYSVGHEEVHSLSMHMPEADIEFWMRIGDNFMSTFNVLRKIGLLSVDPVRVGNASISPLAYIAKVLPTPESFASEYRGTVCVGALLTGRKNGKPARVFMHTLCKHEDTYLDLETHVTAFTTAIPAMAAAMLIATGEWDAGTMVHPEELSPDLFLDKIRDLGLDWHLTHLPDTNDNSDKNELIGL
jgi:saccharopine dehydrogenase (NAD+, L-lysine-forming)